MFWIPRVFPHAYTQILAVKFSFVKLVRKLDRAKFGEKRKRTSTKLVLYFSEVFEKLSNAFLKTVYLPSSVSCVYSYQIVTSFI